MPRQCSVCKHKARSEIDMRLAFQVVNVAEVAREFGLGSDSVARHRRKHLPGFLPAFAADTEPRSVGTIRAEAERLYLTTLDALAQAEAGVRVQIDEDGTVTSRVSMSTVARLIREARAGLDLLTKLSVASGGDDVAPAGVNAELDQRIAAALDRVVARGEQRALDTTIDVEVVADDVSVDEGMAARLAAHAEPPAATPTTPGPGAAEPPPR